MRKPKARAKPIPRAKPSLPKVKLADDDELEPEVQPVEEIPWTEKQAPVEEKQMFGKSHEETDKFKRYRKFELAEMRPYVEGEDMTKISVGDEEVKLGCPKKGDMVCRNVANHDDQWLMAEEKFKHHYEAI